MKMQNDSSRSEILQKIEAVGNRRPVSNEVPEQTGQIYQAVLPDAIQCFISELESVSGQCILCDNESDLFFKLNKYVYKNNFPFLFCRDTNIIPKLEAHKIPFSTDSSDFESLQAGITGCEFLVARTGSVLVTSVFPSGRQMNVFPPVHIVLASVSQLVSFPEDALAAVQSKYEDCLPSSITFITGPSRTADIEKTLILGAHGPKEMVVFLCKE